MWKHTIPEYQTYLQNYVTFREGVVDPTGQGSTHILGM